MPNDVYIHPTPAEQRLLERKAAEYGVSVDEFVAWGLRQALYNSSSNTKRGHICAVQLVIPTV